MLLSPLETYHIQLSSITLFLIITVFEWCQEGKECRVDYNTRLHISLVVLTSLIKYFPNTPFIVVYTCKKCGELNYLTPHAFWNTSDFGAKCEKCEKINTITLENEELKKQVVLY